MTEPQQPEPPQQQEPQEPQETPQAETPAEPEPSQVAPQPAMVPPRKIQVKAFPWIVLTDFALRYIVFLIWRAGYLKNGIFWGLQIVGVTWLVTQWNEKRKTAVIKALGVENENGYEIRNSAGWIIVMLLVTANNSIHAYNDVHPGAGFLYSALRIFIVIFVALYTIGLCVTSPSMERVDDDPRYRAFEREDENDRLTVGLKTELDNLIRRVEAYTLESTLIGTIAFTAFVAIVVTEKGSSEAAHEFCAKVIALSHARDWKFVTSTVHLPSEYTVLILIALAALVCSLFFVGVMVARLRFASLVGAASYSVELAVRLNEKEKELTKAPEAAAGDPRDAAEKRKDWVRSQVDRYMEEARLEIDQLSPILVYMTVFRSLGIMSFLATLILSGLWFGPRIAVCFFVVSLWAYLYPYGDALLRDRRLRGTEFVMMIKRKSKLSSFRKP
jgi:hypothetical protein